MVDWNLRIGTAEGFDALGDAAALHAGMGAQSLGDRHGVRRGWVLNGAQIPERAGAIRGEGMAIEAGQVVRRGWVCAHGALNGHNFGQISTANVDGSGFWDRLPRGS